MLERLHRVLSASIIPSVYPGGRFEGAVLGSLECFVPGVELLQFCF